MFLLILAIGAGCAAATPLGNSMNPESHATALVPIITGTNVPLDEKSIEAPIEDSREVEKIRQSVQDIAENKDHPENLPVIGGFAKDHLNSTLPPDATETTPSSSSLVPTTGTSPSLPPVTYAPTTVLASTPSSTIITSTKKV